MAIGQKIVILRKEIAKFVSLKSQSYVRVCHWDTIGTRSITLFVEILKDFSCNPYSVLNRHRQSGVGEGLFFAGMKHVAIKIVASYTEDQIITSDPSQLLAIKEEKKRYAAEQK